MIVLSSHRPSSVASAEIWGNQVAARESWDKAFDSVCYFGPPEPELDGNIVTAFHPCDGKPTIKELAGWAAKAGMWVALINADIILAPNFREVTDRMLKNTSVQAAISGRYNFEVGKPFSTAVKNDQGIDFFCAHPAIWERVFQFIPSEFKLGRCGWDTWVLGAFNHYAKGRVGDLTPAHLVYHPIHGERGDQSTPEKALKSPFMSLASWPTIKIT